VFELAILTAGIDHHGDDGNVFGLAGHQSPVAFLDMNSGFRAVPSSDE
jgi:hypothetical protein